MRRPKRLRQKAYDYEQGFRQPIHPVWLDGQVPGGFWTDGANRRRYMIWLGRELGFRRYEDWYRVSTDDFKQNHGATPLALYWRWSAVEAVRDTFPEYDWKDWLFKTAPRRFWQSAANCRSYIQWLGEQLGIEHPADWYHVTNEDFKAHAGAAFLVCTRSTVPQAVIEYGPKHDFKEWLFDVTSGAFWTQPANQRRYMTWLAKQLGYRTPDDWYRLTIYDLYAHHGRGLLEYYGKSVVAIVRNVFPRRTWLEWKFARVPAGFWRQRANRRRYFDWLGRELGFKKPRDWLRIRRRDINENYGGTLLLCYPAYERLLQEYLPELSWHEHPQFKKNRRLTQKQILTWAEAHFRQTGNWPTRDSGRIKGEPESWSSINQALYRGRRGLPGGSSLARLLAKHAGRRH